MALTEREKAILRLKADGVSDYRIARKLRMETPNVTRSRKNALKKLEHAKEDLEFSNGLKTQPSYQTRFQHFKETKKLDLRKPTKRNGQT